MTSTMPRGLPFRPLLFGLVLALSFTLTPLSAQFVLDFEERLDDDRPESWAMQTFGSISLLTDLGSSAPPDRGSIEFGLEGGWIPSLSEEERRVGFNGQKVEDLNRSSVLVRPRATFGLGAGFALTLGWVPPVEIDGIEADLISAALSRQIVDGERFRLALGLAGQYGTATGDITCDQRTVNAGTDPIANPFGCEQPSTDEITLQSLSLALTAAFSPAKTPRVEPYVTLAAHRFDNEFQVDARYNGLIDRTLLTAEGDTWSVATGVNVGLATDWRLSAEVFATRLDVLRPPATDSESEDLVNTRVLLSYRLR